MEHNGFEYMDLGLSVYWATCNVGAEKPTDVGLYFQWGDVVGYSENDALNEIKRFGKDYYGDEFMVLGSSESCLTKEHDAANAYMGGDWRMPTIEEIDELASKYRMLVPKIYKNCMAIEDGFLLPIGGYWLYDFINRNGSGFYWSSTPPQTNDGRNSKVSRGLSLESFGSGFKSVRCSINTHYWYVGSNIRAVLPK